MFSLVVAAALAAAPLEDVAAQVDGTVVTVRAGVRNSVRTESHVAMELTIFTGSGVVVHGEGYIVTAAHVVEDAEGLEVEWRTGQRADAEIVSLSRTEDVALLKAASMPKGAPVARLGNSDALRPGQRLFAIGAPLGLEHTLTAGVVSALRENPPRGLVPRRLVQTDVALNQGNSGGPLFDENGAVVGIASFILSQSGGSVGLNFAVPSNTVRERLFEKRLPYLGVSLRLIPRDVAEVFNWPVAGGILVEKVKAGSPADKAGLRGGTVSANVGGNQVLLGGDLIVKVGALDADDSAKVGEYLRSLLAGEVLRYEVLRGGRRGQVDVVMPPSPVVPALPPLPAAKK